MPSVLLIGGKGNIGAGLRTYLPKLDPAYHIVSIDLPGAPDKTIDPGAQQNFIDLDITAQPDRLNDLIAGKDLVVYLARKSPLLAMNQMTDFVFDATEAHTPAPLVIGSSSVHAIDGAYTVHEGVLSTLSERRFNDLTPFPKRIPATIPAHPVNDYGREKTHVERRVQRLAALGRPAVAARWGGINAKNEMTAERGYFALWCHQEDAARFVHACYTTHKKGALRSGAHYFVVSNNTHNIFDLEIPKRELNYHPLHNAETFYT